MQRAKTAMIQKTAVVLRGVSIQKPQDRRKSPDKKISKPVALDDPTPTLMFHGLAGVGWWRRASGGRI